MSNPSKGRGGHSWSALKAELKRRISRASGSTAKSLEVNTKQPQAGASNIVSTHDNGCQHNHLAHVVHPHPLWGPFDQSELPYDIWHIIIALLSSASPRTLRNLSQVSRQLHDRVDPFFWKHLDLSVSSQYRLDQILSASQSPPSQPRALETEKLTIRRVEGGWPGIIISRSPSPEGETQAQSTLARVLIGMRNLKTLAVDDRGLLFLPILPDNEKYIVQVEAGPSARFGDTNGAPNPPPVRDVLYPFQLVQLTYHNSPFPALWFFLNNQPTIHTLLLTNCGSLSASPGESLSPSALPNLKHVLAHPKVLVSLCKDRPVRHINVAVSGRVHTRYYGLEDDLDTLQTAIEGGSDVLRALSISMTLSSLDPRDSVQTLYSRLPEIAPGLKFLGLSLDVEHEPAHSTSTHGVDPDELEEFCIDVEDFNTTSLRQLAELECIRWSVTMGPGCFVDSGSRAELERPNDGRETLIHVLHPQSQFGGYEGDNLRVVQYEMRGSKDGNGDRGAGGAQSPESSELGVWRRGMGGEWSAFPGEFESPTIAGTMHSELDLFGFQYARGQEISQRRALRASDAESEAVGPDQRTGPNVVPPSQVIMPHHWL